jgi:hypothetical protein
VSFPLFVAASSRLHAHACAEAGHAVYRDALHALVLSAGIGGVADAEVCAVGVFAGEVEEVDAGEDDEEAANEGDGVDGVCRVEAAEEDEGGDEGESRKCDIVEWVDAAPLSVFLPDPAAYMVLQTHIFVSNWLNALLK